MQLIICTKTVGDVAYQDEELYIYAMPVKTSIPFTDGIFSITFTCTNWLPLIEILNGYNIIYSWFDHLKSKGHSIIGYVIMPNHLHVVIGFRKSHQSINTVIGNGKRFMAYEIVQRLKTKGETELLNKLFMSVEAGRKANHKSIMYGSCRSTGKNANRKHLFFKNWIIFT